jgi:hypothetical protein
VDERTPLGFLAPRRIDPDAELLQPALGPVAELVVAERRQEDAVAGEPGELNGRHRPSPGRLGEEVARVDDLTGARNPLDASEVGPLDVPDDRDPHRGGS